MTKKQCLIKIKSMIPDVRQSILEESERLLDSKGINPDDYLQDFVLAKIVLTVALNNLKDQYRPLSDEYRPLSDDFRKATKRLSHF